ncbi:MAG TPA: ABC transporter ATP-binding protein [Clostridia bacterium]|nr:ABC transporter ATP-binding protein [Clostridia bacterium]
MGSFKWLWGYLKKFKLKLFIGYSLVSIFSVLTLINPYISGKIVDNIILTKNISLLPGYLVLMGSVVIAISLIQYLLRYIFEVVSQGIVIKVRDDIYKKLQSLDFSFFDRAKAGDNLARLTGDTESIRHFVGYVMWTIYQFFIIFITVLIIFFSMNVIFTVSLLVVTPFVAIVARKLSKSVKPAFAAIREQFSRLNSVAQENISGNRVVKAFAREDYEIVKFEYENDAYMEKNLVAASIWQKYLPLLDGLANTLNVLIIIVGGFLVIKNVITIGQMVTFNGLVWALNNPMRMSGWLINDTQRFVTSADKVMYLLDTDINILNNEFPVVKKDLQSNIKFNNVSFKHGHTMILKNISFEAKKGETIGIVGPTGSGKSSIVNLMARYYDCFEGEILYDDVNVKDLDLHMLRKNVSMTMQDVFLFSDSVQANISYGNPDATFESVEAAAKIACAHDFITKMSEGYDTIIGEYGVGLSGGQKQRISLARAILKDPSVLIFDDTTSAVDMETEHEIQLGLKSISSEKTTFIIAHRISSVRNANLILVVENGEITERGTHDELMKSKGYYYHTYMNQYGDFENTGNSAKGGSFIG